MKTKLIALVAAIASFAALATDMDRKGRVIATVETVGSGTVELTCNDPGSWKFDLVASVDAGRDVNNEMSELPPPPPEITLVKP